MDKEQYIKSHFKRVVKIRFKRVVKIRYGKTYVYDKKKNKLVLDENPPLIGYLCGCGCNSADNYSDMYLYEGTVIRMDCLKKKLHCKIITS